MGVLEGFMATWTKAYNQYGQGAPPSGAHFDQSSQLRSLQGQVDGYIWNPNDPIEHLAQYRDIASISNYGDHGLQRSSALNEGLIAQSREMLEWSERTSNESYRGMWSADYMDATLGAMLEASSHDPVAVHDLIGGQYGKDFLKDMATHQWNDDGRAVGHLFDWVGQEAENDPTGRAAQTAHVLAEYTSSHSKELLQLPWTGNDETDVQPVGQVNPELTRSWAHALSPYLDDMVANNTDHNNQFEPLDKADQGKVEPVNTRHLMSVLMSDHPPLDQKPNSGSPQTASEILFDSTQHHINDAFQKAALSADGPKVDDFSMQSAGRLQAALNLGGFDEASSRLHNEYQARHDAWQLQGKLYELGSGVVDQFGAPGGAAADILNFSKEYVIGPEPKEGHAPNLNIPGTFPTQLYLAEILAQRGAGDMSQINAIFHNNALDSAPEQEGGKAYGDYHNSIMSYLKSVGKPGTVDGLMQTYWNTYTSSIYGET